MKVTIILFSYRIIWRRKWLIDLTYPVSFNIAYLYLYIFILAWNWDGVYWCNVMQYALINLPIPQNRCPVAFADVLWFSWTDEAVRLLVNNQIEYYFILHRNEPHFEMSWRRGEGKSAKWSRRDTIFDKNLCLPPWAMSTQKLT